MLLACNKDKTETLEMRKVEFTVRPGDWYATSGGYAYEAYVPELTQDVLQNGSIVGYYSLYMTGWTPVPNINPAGIASIRASFANTQISLGYLDYDQVTDLPTTDIHFKFYLTH